MATAPHTHALGYYIRDMLGDGYIDAAEENPFDPESPEGRAWAADHEPDSIDHVDDSDPSNLRLNMASGAVFVVRITREG